MKKKVVIIGGGPAGLSCASFLDAEKFDISIFDQKKSVGRKFLVAGEGGFNLTHSEELDVFVSRYSHSTIKKAVEQFSNSDFRLFLSQIGIETYIGSSGKIFPKEGIKPVEVLKAWKQFLKPEVQFFTNHTMLEIHEKFIDFQTDKGLISVKYDYLVFALGGSSWKKTGSDGNWLSLIKSKNIEVSPFKASNSSILLEKNFYENLEGDLLKNIRLFSASYYCNGDIRITQFGWEGKPVYALNASFRKGEEVCIDFKPQLSEEDLTKKMQLFPKRNDFFSAIKLPKAIVQILKSTLSKEDFLDDFSLIHALKKCRIPFLDFRPIDEVISTVGGVSMEEITLDFQSKTHRSWFFIGEMLDWDAPTGGYLLQACVSSGNVCAKKINQE